MERSRCKLAPADDIKNFARLLQRYDEHMSGVGQVNNFRKFKLLQDQSYAQPGTTEAEREKNKLDVAKWIELFPQDAHTGERPTVVRGAVKFNGVGVGPQREERVEVAHEAVRAARRGGGALGCVVLQGRGEEARRRSSVGQGAAAVYPAAHRAGWKCTLMTGQ